MSSAIKLLTYEQKRDIGRKDWRAHGAGMTGTMIGVALSMFVVHKIRCNLNHEILGAVVGGICGYYLGKWWYRRGQNELWWLWMMARYPDLRRRPENR